MTPAKKSKSLVDILRSGMGQMDQVIGERVKVHFARSALRDGSTVGAASPILGSQTRASRDIGGVTANRTAARARTRHAVLRPQKPRFTRALSRPPRPPRPPRRAWACAGGGRGRKGRGPSTGRCWIICGQSASSTAVMPSMGSTPGR